MGDSARLLRETAGPTADPEADEIIENVSYGALAARAAACERPPSPVLELNLKYRIKFRSDTSDTFPAPLQLNPETLAPSHAARGHTINIGCLKSRAGVDISA